MAHLKVCPNCVKKDAVIRDLTEKLKKATAKPHLPLGITDARAATIRREL